MKPYWKRNRSAFIGALFCILASTVFAVTLQFFKGDVAGSCCRRAYSSNRLVYVAAHLFHPS